MGAGIFTIGMVFGGLVLAGMIWPEWSRGMATGWRYVGWALVVLAVLRWRTVLEGLRQSGKLFAFLLVVGALALVFGGEGGLWNLFF